MQTRPAQNAADALAHIAAGGRAFISTYGRLTVLDRKVYRRFEKAGAWLLKDDGAGIRIRRGNASDFLFAGQLKIITEE